MAQTNEPVILSIDLGTSGLKAALITIQGRVLGLAVRTHPALPDCRWWSGAIARRMVAGVHYLHPKITGRRCGCTLFRDRHLLFDPGRRHDPGGPRRQGFNELCPMDGYAWEA